MVYIYKEYCSAMRKNEILPFAAMWMELEGIMLSEIVRERQIPYVFILLGILRNLTETHGEGEGVKKLQRGRRKTIRNS